MTLQEALKILEETFPGKPVVVCVKLTNYLPQSKVSLYCEGKKWTGEHSRFDDALADLKGNYVPEMSDVEVP